MWKQYLKKGRKNWNIKWPTRRLTTTVGRLLENVLANKIQETSRKTQIHKVFATRISGGVFMSNKFTFSFYSDVLEAVNSGKTYNTVYWDFRNTLFYRVPHEMLTRKVEAHGVGGDVLRITKWRKDRKQKVTISGKSRNGN